MIWGQGKRDLSRFGARRFFDSTGLLQFDQGVERVFTCLYCCGCFLPGAEFVEFLGLSGGFWQSLDFGVSLMRVATAVDRTLIRLRDLPIGP